MIFVNKAMTTAGYVSFEFTPQWSQGVSYWPLVKYDTAIVAHLFIIIDIIIAGITDEILRYDDSYQIEIVIYSNISNRMRNSFITL